MLGNCDFDIESIISGNVDPASVFDFPLSPEGHGSIQFQVKIKRNSDTCASPVIGQSSVSLVRAPSSLQMDSTWHADLDLCEICHVKFSLLLRRHHCRACGINVCNSCSPHEKVIRTISSTAVRICLLCKDAV